MQIFLKVRHSGVVNLLYRWREATLSPFLLLSSIVRKSGARLAKHKRRVTHSRIGRLRKFRAFYVQRFYFHTIVKFSLATLYCSSIEDENPVYRL